MASGPFAKHNPDTPSAEELRLVRLAAASTSTTSPPVLFDAHIAKVTHVRKVAGTPAAAAFEWETGVAGPVLEACKALVSTALRGDDDERARWERLADAMAGATSERVALPGGAGETPLDLSFTECLLSSAFVSGGGIAPPALCSTMLANSILYVRLAEGLELRLLDVLEASAKFWKDAHGGESAAAFNMMVGDAQYLAGRRHDAARSVVAAIEADPHEPYSWAVLCELLAEQDAGAHVNVQGVGAVTLETAQRALAEAVDRQRIGGTIRWPVVALLGLTTAVCIGLVVKRWRRV